MKNQKQKNKIHPLKNAYKYVFVLRQSVKNQRGMERIKSSFREFGGLEAPGAKKLKFGRRFKCIQ